MKSNTTTATNTAYSVSEQTAAYIGCKKELNALYNTISRALELHFVNCTEQLEKDFLPVFNAMGGVIDSYIAASINEQLGDICNNGAII